jgi:hypothetical protein
MSDEFKTGTAVKVKTGITAPDLPEFSIEGWTGQIVQVGGKKAARKYFIEWDADTLKNMPEAYATACEEKQLYHLMTCLTTDQIELS